ncbi:Glutathione ABC transporter substrate-binding protein OS=Lysinibacillus sphaericus OX=1421 GN=LS41612_06010 PE=3 SV=1 [Lysinibacillus sphaericus]
MRKMKMFLLLALMTVVLLQACSTASNNSTEGAKEGAKSVGGELIVLRASDATSLDPHFITDIPSANIIHGKVYETLVAFDRDRKIVPLLAASWEQKDELTWTFTLNKGIKFHDGEDFNAEAVKATFSRILDPATGSPQRDKLSMISEVVVDDPYIVTLKLKNSYAPLLSILASQESSIISPKAVSESADQLATHPVGTGSDLFLNHGNQVKQLH